MTLAVGSLEEKPSLNTQTPPDPHPPPSFSLSPPSLPLPPSGRCLPLPLRRSIGLHATRSFASTRAPRPSTRVTLGIGSCASRTLLQVTLASGAPTQTPAPVVAATTTRAPRAAPQSTTITTAAPMSFLIASTSAQLQSHTTPPTSTPQERCSPVGTSPSSVFAWPIRATAGALTSGTNSGRRRSQNQKKLGAILNGFDD